MYDVDTPDTVITLADWSHKPAMLHGNLDYPVRALDFHRFMSPLTPRTGLDAHQWSWPRVG